MSAVKKEITIKVVDKKAQNDMFVGGNVNSKGTVLSTHTEELVVALCGPIGSPIFSVSEKIERILIDEYSYECKKIKISELIKEYGKKTLELDVDDSTEFLRVKNLIDNGDKLRGKYGSGLFAELVTNQITFDREQRKEEKKGNRICYIVDSIKNKEEVELLKLIYGDILFSVGIFSSVEDRVSELKSKGMTDAEVHQLIDIDSGEEISHGQQVSDIFPGNDFFLRVDEQTESQNIEKIQRFIDLIFGTKVITPTNAEAAMLAASTAAKNSACMSRQVGAAIADQEGRIISLGWNDVPKFKGGLYQDVKSTNKDKRCWNYKGGTCSNDKEKDYVATSILNELIKEGIISPTKKEDAKKILGKNGRLKNLIEFSRAVHAEMHAIITAGTQGNGNLAGTRLYCTTYPCHSCARHIVAAGITEVYFIEPYRKSLATKLHNDSLTENEKDLNKVRLIAFEGVSPNRYHTLFSFPSTGRKRDGKLIATQKKSARPRYEKSLEALHVLEAIVTKSLVASGVIESIVQEQKNEAPETT